MNLDHCMYLIDPNRPHADATLHIHYSIFTATIQHLAAQKSHQSHSVVNQNFSQNKYYNIPEMSVHCTRANEICIQGFTNCCCICLLVVLFRFVCLLTICSLLLLSHCSICVRRICYAIHFVSKFIGMEHFDCTVQRKMKARKSCLNISIFFYIVVRFTYALIYALHPWWATIHSKFKSKSNIKSYFGIVNCWKL